MSNFKLRLLIYFATISASTLLISNLAAVKLWNFFGIAVDGGVVVFPITYIAKNIILAGFFINILAIIVFYIVIALPPYEGWTMQTAMASVLGFTPRIIIGSLTAYVCSNFLNNYIFTRLKNGNGLFASSFIARALGSSAFAHIIDCVIFETIAFIGVLTFQEFLAQAVFAYVLGIGFEIVFSPIEAFIANLLRGKMTDDKL